MSSPESSTFKQYKISSKEFRYLKDLIYKEAGIHLTDAKQCLVQTRIGKLMRRNNINGYDDLFHRLDIDSTGKYLQLVLDSISTNHTFFFREDTHFTYLSTQLIPELVERKVNPIRIWSSACSSGEEPYTIGITMEETLGKLGSKTSYSIFASDISNTILEKAHKGIYPLADIETIPDSLKRKYFKKGKNQYNQWVKVKDSLREKVSFARHNLLEKLAHQNSFDIIFCRNVMIYFDVPTKEKIVLLLKEKLNVGGYLINGHSESITNLNHGLTLVKPTVYKRTV